MCKQSKKTRIPTGDDNKSDNEGYNGGDEDDEKHIGQTTPNYGLVLMLTRIIQNLSIINV